jgi:hypothetical protein
MIEENTIGGDASTRTGKRNTDRFKETNMKRKTLEGKEKMTVTQDNFPFEHVCDDIAIDDDTPYIRVYCQNVNGIFDR